MKIERQEKSIRLIPESEWEKQCLKEIRNKGIQKISFQDDWDQTGYLQLEYPVHPWDE